MTLPTLTEFFNTVFYPNRIQGRLNWKTENSYRETIKLWRVIMGDDLPLDAVDDDKANYFIVELLKRKGKRAPTMMKSSVGKHVVNLKSMFKMAGPRAYCPYGRNLIPHMPYFDPPKQDKKKPKKDFFLEEIHAMFRAADVATYPKHLGISPAAWWRSVLVFDYYTGLRITALVSVTYDMMLGNWLEIPGEFCKGGNSTRQFVHPEAMQYAEMIRTADRPQLFGFEGWAKKRRYAYNQLRKIQAAAGMSAIRQLLAFHSIRSCHCTQIVRHSMDQQAGLVAAQQSVGHADLSVTLNHYVNGDVMDDMKAKVILRLPSPVPPEFRRGTPAPAPQPVQPQSSNEIIFSGFGFESLSM